MKKVLSIGLSICMAALFGCSAGAGKDTASQTTVSAETDTKGRQDGRDKGRKKTETEDTTAAAKESSIDGYVYDGDPIEIHWGTSTASFH